MSEYIAGQEESLRSSSFFLEPASFAQYLIPYIAIELFNPVNKRLISTRAVFATIVIVMLSSGGGLVLCSLLWGIWFFWIKIKIVYKIRAVSIVVLFMSAFGGMYLNSGKGALVRGRFTDAASIADTGQAQRLSSAYLRLFRGYEVFGQMKGVEKWVGIGQGNQRPFIKGNNQLKSKFREGDFYLNCIQYVLVFGGIIGLSLFLLYWITILKNTCMAGKAIVIVFLVLSCSGSVYNSPTMLQYVILAIFANKLNISHSNETKSLSDNNLG